MPTSYVDHYLIITLIIVIIIFIIIVINEGLLMSQTSDVQTASLVIINTVPHISSEVLKDVRVVSWIEK